MAIWESSRVCRGTGSGVVQQVIGGGTITIEGEVLSNPDNDPLTYSWSLAGSQNLTPAEQTIIENALSNANGLTVSFPSPDVDTNGSVLLNILLSASDGIYTDTIRHIVYIYSAT